jgi:hypothetical protein
MVLVAQISFGWEDRPADSNTLSKTGRISGFTCNIGTSSGLVGPDSFVPWSPNAAQDSDKDRIHGSRTPHSARTVFHVQLCSVPAGVRGSEAG